MFNLEKMSAMLEQKWKDQQLKVWGPTPTSVNEVTATPKGDFIIGIGKIVGTQPIYKDKFMQRYYLYVYSVGQLCLLWSDSNVVDADSTFTVEQVIERAKNNLAHELNKLNKL